VNKTDDIRGLILPIPTVFREDGQVDEATLTELVDFYLEAKVHAIFTLGSFGQGPALAPDERKRVADLIVKRVNHRVPCIVHVGTVDPYTSIALGRHARDIGADAIALVGPYYYSDRSEYEIIEHFRMVDRAIDLPILVYNNPQYSGYPIPPAMMARLVDAVPNIFGSKLAMGSVDEAMAYLHAVKQEFAPFVLASSLITGMAVGVKGTISPPLAPAPELGVRLVEAIDERRWEDALHLQTKVNQLHSLFMRLSRSFGRTVAKESLNLRGFKVKMYPRWPARPFTIEARAELEKVLQSVLGDGELTHKSKTA